VAVGCRDPKLLNVIMIDFLRQHRGRLSKNAPPRPRSMSTTRRDREFAKLQNVKQRRVKSLLASKGESMLGLRSTRNTTVDVM
jgi:hypothetical protein